MAYLFGIVSSKERQRFETRGWKFEDLEEVIDEIRQHIEVGEPEGSEFVALWVDSDLSDIMDAPGWEGYEED